MAALMLVTPDVVAGFVVTGLGRGAEGSDGGGLGSTSCLLDADDAPAR